jgi:ankyrin repeat protein
LSGGQEIDRVITSRLGSFTAINSAIQERLRGVVLCFAAEAALVPAVTALLARGAAVSQCAHTGDGLFLSPLLRCCLGRSLDESRGPRRRLLQKKEEEEEEEEEEERRVECTLLLLRAGANMEAQGLLFAAQNGAAAQVRVLLQHGAAVNYAAPVTGYTAAHYAARWGALPTLRALCEHGAVVSQAARTARSGLSCLDLASANGHLDVAQFLVEEQGQLLHLNTSTQRREAEEEERWRQSEQYSYPLLLCAGYWTGEDGGGQAGQLIAYLLQRGADPLLVDGQGSGLLHLLAREGKRAQRQKENHRERMHLLHQCILRGVPVLLRNRMKATPVHVAAYYGNTSAMKLFLAALLRTHSHEELIRGLEMVDSEGRTAGQVAEEEGEIQLAETMRRILRLDSLLAASEIEKLPD